MTEIPFRLEAGSPAGEARLEVAAPRDGRVWITLRAGEARTGGHALTVTGIARSGPRLVVQVRIVVPAADAIVTQVLTAPAQTVSVSAADVAGVLETVALDQHGTELARLSV